LERFGDDAKPLAGGQSLVPMMAFRLAAFAHLVDLNRIASLTGVSADGEDLVIGAGTRQHVLERDQQVGKLAPLVSEATALIGHFQIRNRGTIGGSLAHADPAAEYPAVALATDATLEVANSAGVRTVKADDLFDSAYVTSLEPDELITSVRIPVRRVGEGFAIREITRRMGDFALAGCVVKVTVDDEQSVSDARVVVFGVAARPLRLPIAENALLEANGDELEDALRAATADLEPSEDALATSRYRKTVVRHVAAQTIEQAMARAKQGVGHP
jgi:carbon-monoxide dehydrogenase medium subunit